MVTLDMNRQLTYEFSALKFETALKQMAPIKSPGLDSMPLLFYQNCWSLVGSDVNEAIFMYLNLGTLPQVLGHSFITLIPKVKSLEYILQHRSISMSNVLYRVFSKVIANRLKKILPHLIF